MSLPAQNDTPRGSYTGAALCAPKSNRRFYQCPICGGWVDSTDLKAMAEHEGGGAASPPEPLAEAS